jgi:protein-disulfide isomerase
LSTTAHTSPRQTRRERRAAERADAATTRNRHAARTRRGSPVVLITLFVVALALVSVAGLLLLQGGVTPAGTNAGAPTAPLTTTPTELAADRTLGAAAAPVTLDVWTDFQCPVCGQYARTVEPGLVSKYVTPGTLRIVHHDAAFQGSKGDALYDESVESGAGARCAAAQGRYWPFQDWTFANQAGENQGAFAAARLTSIAVAADLDVTAWQACIGTGDQQRAVRSETAQAVAAGVNATPTMRINGQVIVGLRSVTELGALIETAAAAATGG